MRKLLNALINMTIDSFVENISDEPSLADQRWWDNEAIFNNK
jgi:hypothetical protein